MVLVDDLVPAGTALVTPAVGYKPLQAVLK